MTGSGQEGTTGGAGSSARRWRTLAAFTPAIALLSILFCQIDGASARGLAEDRRLNLSVDLEALNEPGAGDERAEASDDAPLDRHSSKTRGSVPEAGPRWERDPGSPGSRGPGDPRDTEFEFQESEFGNQIRRFLGR